MLRPDSVFGPLLESPFADEQPMISRSIIARSLDQAESPLAAEQKAILTSELDLLLDQALPMVDAQNLKGIVELSWNAGLLLQRPIYALWADGYGLGAVAMQQEVRASIHRAERSQYSGIAERFALPTDVAQLLLQFLDLEPGQIVASAVQAAALNRAIQLAGNFGRSQITEVKQHLIAAIVPQADTGDPIGRKELLRRIESTLHVGAVRADNIARTELTSAYNVGRVEMGRRSSLVEAFRFIPIEDNRTTDICRSRSGLIIPADDTALLNANTPALHFRCRSTLSPIMPRVNAAHRRMMADSERRAENRELVPLMPGWNGAQADKVAQKKTQKAAEKAALDRANKKAAQDAAQKAALERANKRAAERAARRAAEDAVQKAANERRAVEAEATRRAAQRAAQPGDVEIISGFGQRAIALRQEKRALYEQFTAGRISATEVDNQMRALGARANAQTQELSELLAQKLSASSTEPISTRQHGMSDYEELKRSRFAGLDVYAEGFAADSTPVKSLVKMVEDGWFPDELNRHTESLIFSSQCNKDDAYWEEAYSTANFVSAATGGDGRVVVYNGGMLSHESMAHEMGHNLAKSRYGTTQTSEGSDFWQVAQASTAPTDYGTNSTAEDFAESVKLYVQYENQLGGGLSFKAEHPERYRIIDRLIKEQDYSG